MNTNGAVCIFDQLPSDVWLVLLGGTRPYMSFFDLCTLCCTSKHMKKEILKTIRWDRLLTQEPYIHWKEATDPGALSGQIYKLLLYSAKRRRFCSMCWQGCKVLPRSWGNYHNYRMAICHICLTTRHSNVGISTKRIAFSLQDYGEPDKIRYEHNLQSLSLYMPESYTVAHVPKDENKTLLWHRGQQELFMKEVVLTALIVMGYTYEENVSTAIASRLVSMFVNTLDLPANDKWKKTTTFDFVIQFCRLSAPMVFIAMQKEKNKGIKH